MIITSRTNPKVVSASLLKEKKYRDNNGLFLIEGKKLFDEAIKCGVELSEVFCLQENEKYCSEKLGKEVTVLSESAFEKISTEKSPQGIISVAKHIDKIHNLHKIYNVEKVDKKSKLILCSMRDPGNVGTVIRTANAFGIDELILSSDCADIYNPKTVRGAMGALFRQKITIVDNLEESINNLKNGGYNVYAAMLDRNAVSLSSLHCNESTVFIVGNEGHGIPESVRDVASGSVFIPMEEDTESLNAATAATVFMWKMYSEK